MAVKIGFNAQKMSKSGGRGRRLIAGIDHIDCECCTVEHIYGKTWVIMGKGIAARADFDHHCWCASLSTCCRMFKRLS